MCSNLEKARFLKILVAEIRAAAAKRRARKAEPAAAAGPADWPRKSPQPALAIYRK